MNIQYFKKHILPTREKEIEKGLNAATKNPIYFVYDLEERIVSGHTEFPLCCNLKEKDSEFGFLDMDEEPENRVFYPNIEVNNKFLNLRPVTRFWIDKYKGIFLTREGADNYLRLQKHNLSDEAYIYVHSPGYRNAEMEKLFEEPKAENKFTQIGRKKEEEFLKDEIPLSKIIENMNTTDKIKNVCRSIMNVLLEKNARYGNSALEPSKVFSKLNSEEGIKIRLDDKINRVKNSNELRKNDIADLIGYLILLSVKKEWNFNDLID